MGQRELLTAAQAKTGVALSASTVARAIKSGFVKPADRIGMSFLYPPEAVDGLIEFVKTRRRRRLNRHFA